VFVYDCLFGAFVSVSVSAASAHDQSSSSLFQDMKWSEAFFGGGAKACQAVQTWLWYVAAFHGTHFDDLLSLALVDVVVSFFASMLVVCFGLAGEEPAAAKSKCTLFAKTVGAVCIACSLQLGRQSLAS
jgi:hypothetical protein